MVLQPFTVDDFSGGITDFATDSEKNQYVKADNILVERSTNAFSRYGSLLFNENFDRPYTFDGIDNTPILTRISSLWNFNEDTNLLASNAKKLFSDDNTLGWIELKGPDGNDFFSKGDESSRVFGSMWKGHLFLNNDSDANPMKVYKDSAGSLRAVQAGLPKFLTQIFYDNTSATDEIVALANDLKTQFLNHFSNVVVHPVSADDISAADITAPDLINGDTLATTITLVTQLMAAYTNHYEDLAKGIGTRLYHSNSLPTTFSAQPNFGLAFSDAPTNFLECAKILNDLKRKYNWHVRSFMGHPSVDAAIVTAASLVHTEDGPLFNDIDFSALLTIANELKRVFNLHLGSVASGTHTAVAHVFDDNLSTLDDLITDFSGDIDTDNIVTLADCTDKDSLIELISHLYGAYRNHQFDAGVAVVYLIGDTDHVNTNQIKNITAITGTVTTGTLANIKVGMFLGYGGSTDAWNKGTKVQSIDIPNAKITLDQNHNGGGAQTGKTFFFSFKKFHTITQATSDSLSLTNLNPQISPDLMLSDDESILIVLYELALKYNKHDASGVTLGIPASIPVPPTLHFYGSTSQLIYDTTLTFKRYNYGFIFTYEYKTLSGETFKDLSTPLYKTKLTLKSIEDVPSIISEMSSVMNSNFNVSTMEYETFGNFDTTNMKVEIYRSRDASSVLRKVGFVQNGVQTFTDSMSDSILNGQETLYTEGGVLDNDPPPRAKFLHITQDNKAYYGNTTRTLNDGSIESIPQRVEQAIVNDPDSVPSGNFIDFPLAVKGISSVRTLPIVFTEEATYRIEGTFNELGQGIVSAVTISDRVGLSGSSSPVQVDGAVIFAGPDQFYSTDGYNVVPLNRAWPDTYKKLILNNTRKNNILGTFDKIANRVWFGCSQNSDENDSAFILDLNFPVNPKRGATFTTASNSTSFAPTALCMFKNQLIRGDSRGYIFKHDFSYRDDPKIDTTKAGSLWEKKVPIYSLKSIAHAMGAESLRKWGSIFQIKFDNTGDFSLQVNSDNDVGRVQGALSPIRVRNKTSQIDERRYFPKGSLFFSAKQVELTNAFVGITNSDTLGLATVDPILKTITLNAGNWPTGFVDYVVALVNDSYVEQYTVIQQIGNTLVVADPDVLLPVAGSYKWVVRGFPKGEKFQVHEYTIWMHGMGVNQTTAANESGENS